MRPREAAQWLRAQVRALPEPVQRPILFGARRFARFRQRSFVWRPGLWLAQRQDSRRRPPAITVIDPADEMFVAMQPSHYFSVGRSALTCVLGGLEAAGVRDVRRVLDVPCGHGRVLRMLQAEWPDAHLTACDINRAGVDFCARTFGAEAVYSANPISSVQTGGGYDLVWVGSLLTHLDQHRWPEMLGWFRDQLRTGGVLIFTTHGDVTAELHGSSSGHWAAAIVRYHCEGFGYAELPSQPGYGNSFSTPEWVHEQIELVGGLHCIRTSLAAWDRHQDVTTCVRT